MIEPTSIPRKVLFIDEPFSEGESLRAKRSRFLWDIISTHYDADLLLLKTNIYQERPVPIHKGYDKLFSLSLAEPNPLFPQSYHLPAEGQANRFKHILDSRRYEMVFFAGLACLPFLYLARKALPKCKFVIDAQHHYLPEAELKWKKNISIANLDKLVDYSRHKFWDKMLFKRDTFCFLANPADEAPVQQAYKLSPDNTFVCPLPLEQGDTGERQFSSLPTVESKHILFWGIEPDADNFNAAKLLVSEIYPRISKKLVEKDIGIYICGAAQLAEVCGGRIRFMEVNSMQDSAFSQLLDSALFVVLPLVAPDTEGRIIQCALAGKGVICTTVSIAGWTFPENCVKTQDTAEELASHVLRWLQYPREAEASAKRLWQYSRENYQSQTITHNILSKLNAWIEDYDQ